MFGSQFVKCIKGPWEHLGYMTTEELPIPSGVTLPKGTWLQAKAGNDTIAALASGVALGFTTQDLDNDGQTSVTQFKNRVIGKHDLPIKKGQAITVRMPMAGAIMEFEGLGACGPGNLVCTSGTGSIASSTIAGGNNGKVPLSFLLGTIRQAQTGDFVQLMLLESALTPETVGNLRIRVRACQGYIK